MAVKYQKRFPRIVQEISNTGVSTDGVIRTWGSISNIKLDDSNYAEHYGPWLTSGGFDTTLTNILQLSSFNFQIPTGAEIKGIKLTVKARSERFGDTESEDKSVKIIKYGYYNLGTFIGSQGEEKSTNTGFALSDTYEEREYGGSADTWGYGVGLTRGVITPEDINSESFGAILSFKIYESLSLMGGPNGIDVDVVSCTVYYESQNIPSEEFEQAEEVENSKKQFFAKIFNPQGEFIANLYEDDFDWVPNFSININDGLSAIRVKLVHTYNDMIYPESGSMVIGGESIETYKGLDRLYNGIKLGYTIVFYLTDKEVINKKIYTGYIAGFNIEKSDEKENFYIDILPNYTRLASLLTKDSSENTTVPYLSQDPANIIKDILSNSILNIDYDDDTIKETGVSRTYTFVSQTLSESLNKTIDLCPYGWFYYLGGDDKFYFKNFTNLEHIQKHTLAMTDIIRISFSRSIYNLRNKVYFLGGGDPQMYRTYNKTGSQNSFGLFEEKLADERVTIEATADTLAENFLKKHSMPASDLQIEILDSNYSKKGYDIESFNVGDIIIIKDDNFDNSETRWNYFNWGQAYWKYGLYSFLAVPAYIQSIQYQYDKAIITCSFELPANENRIEDINRDLTNYRFKDAPDSPDEI
jgi:hypothetical protein